MHLILTLSAALAVAGIIAVGVKMYRDEKAFQRQTKESSVLHY